MNDAICGMIMEPHSAPRAEGNGRTFYFCSEDCGRDCGDNRKEIAREFGRKTISMRS